MGKRRRSKTPESHGAPKQSSSRNKILHEAGRLDTWDLWRPTLAVLLCAGIMSFVMLVLIDHFQHEPRKAILLLFGTMLTQTHGYIAHLFTPSGTLRTIRKKQLGDLVNCQK